MAAHQHDFTNLSVLYEVHCVAFAVKMYCEHMFCDYTC